MEKKKAKISGSCETCALYPHDEQKEYYVCEANLDEDEMSAFLRGADFACPYYRLDDEYAVVRKQM